VCAQLGGRQLILSTNSSVELTEDIIVGSICLRVFGSNRSKAMFAGAKTSPCKGLLALCSLTVCVKSTCVFLVAQEGKTSNLHLVCCSAVQQSITTVRWVSHAYRAPVVKVVLWSRGGGSADEARLEQTPYPFQPH